MLWLQAGCGSGAALEEREGEAREGVRREWSGGRMAVDAVHAWLGGEGGRGSGAAGAGEHGGACEH